MAVSTDRAAVRGSSRPDWVQNRGKSRPLGARRASRRGPVTRAASRGLAPREDGIPLGAYAAFVARIDGIAEATNPVTNVALWRLATDVSGLRLDVWVRKDRCPALPAVGSYATGNLWLAADVVMVEAAGPGYIR